MFLETKNTEKENKMAEVDTLMLSAEHSDIRREAAEHRATMTQENMKGFDRVNADVLRGTSEVIREGMKGDFTTQKAITDSLAQVSNQVDAFEDVTNAAFMTVARDTSDLRAQVTGLGYQVRDGFVAAAKDSEINALKTQIELAKQTTYMSDKIDSQSEKTRELLNELKYHDLNRHLVERNTELVEERHGHRHWRHLADQNQFQGQWAALNSQLQAFQSQLQETRQGMVNFGTMAGVGQSSTSNNVR